MANKILGLAAGLMLGLVLPVQAADTAAGDAAKGKKLHDANCTGCHVQMMGGDGSGIYTRKDRKVGSLTALTHRIETCYRQVGAAFSPEDIKHVVSYLNQTFYKF